jgi:eukaryotic-like serine/threonine-protein kinase
MSALASGMRLADRFTLREPIGTGGMSEVWRAEDDVLGRPVAVKVLTARAGADPGLQSAPWTEARAAARLTHPSATHIYDYGEASQPDGTALPYLVMELVDGQVLADRLRSGPLPWPEAAAVCAQVAAALAAAHRIGVVHRDVKPGNVMLTGTGVKVLDFGIAALAGGQPATDRGRLVGTPAYAAPERLRPGPATPAADVYALGALLYETLTGRPPVVAATWAEAAAAHRAGNPVPPPEVPGLPRQVRRLCMACLSGDPDERPGAEEVADGLAGAAGRPLPGTTVPARPAGYAVGSAALPADPPTVIEDTEALVAEPEPVPDRTPRRLVPGLVGAAVVLGLVLAVLTAAALSRSTASPRLGSGLTRTAPSSSAAAAPALPAATATTPQGIADELDAMISRALATGSIDADTAASLRDAVARLRDSHGGKKVRGQARDLQDTIKQLVGDGKIDQQSADRLAAALQPLTGDDD